MLTQRAMQPSMRQVIRTGQLTQFNNALRLRAVAPTLIATGNYSPHRSTTTKAVTNDDAYSILAKQRLNRPIAPHLGIYRPQTSWILSGLNRITGSVLSGGLYTFAFLYLVSPVFGWHLESATLAASFGALPLLAKFMIKSTIALPFTFHSFNGLRHLAWDTGSQFKNQQVIRTGWTVVGISVATALGLALL